MKNSTRHFILVNIRVTLQKIFVLATTGFVLLFVPLHGEIVGGEAKLSRHPVAYEASQTNVGAANLDFVPGRKAPGRGQKAAGGTGLER
ncbi:MAG: hypothetical protein HY537_18670 [Deltaproteobacteria bacterium]|nr:hypothetical protein [Deltaproteobacteria bacterium]